MLLTMQGAEKVYADYACAGGLGTGSRTSTQVYRPSAPSALGPRSEEAHSSDRHDSREGCAGGAVCASRRRGVRARAGQAGWGRTGRAPPCLPCVARPPKFDLTAEIRANPDFPVKITEKYVSLRST